MSELHRLSNGVRVVVDPMSSLETTALGVWAHAGSVDEAPDEHGVAHLLEHMAFKGTATRSARQIAEEIEAVGGYLNAATSHQRTGYYARIMSKDVGLATDLLADILMNPLFDEKELIKEKEVVVQEIGEAADTPDDVVFEMLQAVCWGDHPLARPILGTPDSVRAQSAESLRAFMKRRYRPASLVVAAAGKVDEQALLALAEERFGGFAAGAETSDRTAPEFVGGAQHDARDIEQTHFTLAFPGASARHDDYFATRVFADILGGGMSSRLFQIIREERGLAYSVYAFADGYEDCGLVGTYVGADGGQIGPCAEIIRSEIESLAAAVNDEELERARALLRASVMMSLENPAARAEAAARQIHTYGCLLTPSDILQRIDAVDASDIKRCAARAASGAISIAIVGPGDMGAAERVFCSPGAP